MVVDAEDANAVFCSAPRAEGAGMSGASEPEFNGRADAATPHGSCTIAIVAAKTMAAVTETERVIWFGRARRVLSRDDEAIGSIQPNTDTAMAMAMAVMPRSAIDARKPEPVTR